MLITFLFTACQTVTTAPDGTVTKKTDIDTTIAMTQLALTSAQEVYAMYQQYSATQLQISQAEKERQDSERAARVDRLEKTLKTLIELKNQIVVSGTTQ